MEGQKFGWFRLVEWRRVGRVEDRRLGVVVMSFSIIWIRMEVWDVVGLGGTDLVGFGGTEFEVSKDKVGQLAFR